MKQAVDNFRDRDYWIVEGSIYAEPSFRLYKCARMINDLSGGRACSLLDVGCGPAALQPLLNRNISYYGIDIAIREPAANLQERDVAHERLAFEGRSFDFVVAMGFFEYMGQEQNRKFEEIRDLLKPDGKFVMSYINFAHCRRKVWPNYNNVRSIADMSRSLDQAFHLDKCFPASHHWRQKQPGKRSLRALQIRVNFEVPIVSPLFAVEYFFVCSPRV